MASPQGEHDHDGSNTPQHHAHGHRRLLEFVRPNGVKVHIAHTPEQHAQLQRELSEKHPEGDFDVFVSGTAEHVSLQDGLANGKQRVDWQQISAVRELHSHHAARRDTLRSNHGQIYDEFETVKNDLDRLQNELHMLTEHSVSLDANFSKYGYSAHLRTKQDNSEQNSLYGDDESSIQKHKDRTAEALKFWRRPVIRQYFHKGLLWRSSQKGEVFSFELFVDLVYVGVIGIVGDKTAEDPTGKALVEYVVLMCMSYKIWNDATMIVNWFEIDDISQRLSVLFYVVFLFGFTTNIVYAWDSTYTALIAFFVGQQIFKATWLLWVAYLLPNIAGVLTWNTLLAYMAAGLWIGSIHVPYPSQLALIAPAICLDLFGQVFVVVFMRVNVSGALDRFRQKYLDFYPALNIEHRVERTNAFISLVFGYSVLTILFQNRDSFPMHVFLGKGMLGLTQAFCFNWLYFEIDNYLIHVHAIRRSAWSSLIWVSAHLPMVMGYVLGAATLGQLVLAHDCLDSDPETLGEAYVNRSVGEVPPGIRWFYCGGIGVTLLSMGVISFCHVHKRVKNVRLKKRPRLFVRACVAIIIICMPLTTKLTSLDLISITTALVFFILCLDLYGNTCQGQQFWTGGFCLEEKKKCTYVANLKIRKHQRRDIEGKLHRGEHVSLSDLLRRHSSMSSLESHEGYHGGHF